MAHAIKYDFTPFEDYLAGERDVDIRSEYVDGLIYAMAGASETHNTITSSFNALIETHLRDGCRVWQSDMKVVIRNKGQKFSYYPDIMAACGDNTDDLYVRTNPSGGVLPGNEKRTAKKIQGVTGSDASFY